MFKILLIFLWCCSNVGTVEKVNKLKSKFCIINFFLLTIMLNFTNLAHSETMEICKLASANTNKSLPIKKDNVTILRDTGCISASPKNIFIYFLEVSVTADVAKRINYEKEIKPQVLTLYCTDPKVRVFLNAFDVDNRYYTKKGEFVGSFYMTAKECK